MSNGMRIFVTCTDAYEEHWRNGITRVHLLDHIEHLTSVSGKYDLFYESSGLI